MSVPATQPVWPCAQRWLEVVRAVLATAEGIRVCARIGCARSTVMLVAEVEADGADHTTGRGMFASHATVSARMQRRRGGKRVCTKTVQRARRCLEALDLAVTEMTGRHLSAAEREAAAARGRKLQRVGSVRSLLVPKRWASIDTGGQAGQDPPVGKCARRPSTLRRRSQRRGRRPQLEVSEPSAAAGPAEPNVHPPRLPEVVVQSSRGSMVTKRACARSGRAARPDLAVQRLAARLALRCPWWATGHIGRLCGVLQAVGIDDHGWSTQDVMDLLEARNRDVGLFSLTPDRQRNPLGLLRHQLIAAGAMEVEAPQQRRERERQERSAAATARRQTASRHRAQMLRDRSDPDRRAARQQLIASAKAIAEQARRASRRRAGGSSNDIPADTTLARYS